MKEESYHSKNKERINRKKREEYQKDKDKIRKRNDNWRNNNKDKFRNCQLVRKFGISIDDYNDMLKEQNYRCKICNTHEDELTLKLAVDHNHLTGKVRGLLCGNCNVAIGMLKDSEILLLKAIFYLKENN